MTDRTPHVLSSKTVTAPTGLYRLNRYELFDVMSFLDRGSLHSLTLVSYKFGAQLERWPDDACLIPNVHITFRFDAATRRCCCCCKRKRPAKRGRCRFHFGSSTWQEAAGYKQVRARELCPGCLRNSIPILRIPSSVAFLVTLQFTACDGHLSKAFRQSNLNSLEQS